MANGPGGGVPYYIENIGMRGPKGYGFSAIFVINTCRVSILAILVMTRVLYVFCTLKLHSDLFF